MPEPADRSESGSPIYRYGRRDKRFIPAVSASDNIEAIGRHIGSHVGDPAKVFHELVSDRVHVDVHIVQPTPRRNFYTLITSGMSDLPMKVPAGQEDKRFAELMICLPPQWNLGEKHQVTGQGALADERNYWPIRWLKILARFPHQYDSWFGPGHTIPNGDPPRPFADDTKFCCVIFMPPATVAREFWKLQLPDRIIRFMALWPLYREEMDFKLAKGFNALLDRLKGIGYPDIEIVNVNRPNVCAKRLGLF